MHHPVADEHHDESLQQAVELLRPAARLAVLTGAGVSAESGIATFRGAGGLWEGHRVEEVASPEAFERDPELVWRFYHMRRAAVRAAQPNPGHHALVALERRWAGVRAAACSRSSGNFTLITQNIDGLHRRAGSQNVLEIHGTLSRVRCSGCGAVEDRGLDELPAMPTCGACNALLRPDVVWFGEALPTAQLEAAQVAAYECQCFLVVGTSAIVYPAAGLVPIARHVGARVIEINLEATQASPLADVSLFGNSGEILPQLVQRLG